MIYPWWIFDDWELSCESSFLAVVTIPDRLRSEILASKSNLVPVKTISVVEFHTVSFCLHKSTGTILPSLSLDEVFRSWRCSWRWAACLDCNAFWRSKRNADTDAPSNQTRPVSAVNIHFFEQRRTTYGLKGASPPKLTPIVVSYVFVTDIVHSVGKLRILELVEIVRGILTTTFSIVGAARAIAVQRPRPY
jgi:hypothetical protein